MRSGNGPGPRAKRDYKMAAFNDSLPSGSVVVAIDSKYNDNDGAYHLAYVWNGETLEVVNYSNGRNLAFDAAVKDATPEQVAEAAGYFAANKMDLSKLGFDTTYIGCTVILARSRKAPNKTPLRVVNWRKGGYNSYNNQHDPERVCVALPDSDDVAWVNVGCIKEITRGCPPWWA